MRLLGTLGSGQTAARAAMISLQKGTTLIEASAGTGKTYTLCRIALQLTLQRGITLDRILAVTFTEAATEELAARLHELYQACLRELETNDYKEELLLALSQESAFNAERAKRALRYSLEVFDEAPISTIHGFCKRSLELVALEAQTPLDAEISPVENELIEQLQSEYIRQTILESSPALSVFVGSDDTFAKRLRDLGKQSSNHPEATLRPAPQAAAIESLDRAFQEIPQALEELLSTKSTYLPHLRGRSKLQTLLSAEQGALDRAAERGRLLPTDLEWLENFTKEKWTKGINKSGAHLELPRLVATVDQTLSLVEAAVTSLLFHYRPWLAERLASAKQQANVISFNDLLHLLRRALRDDKGSRIRELIGSRYDAALIDEFQDTDRVQLQIVESLFASGQHYLFYIGDPKQAIYRFRGADIYAYFQATQQAGIQVLSLEKNYRSDPCLVQAVNRIFSTAKAGFIDPRIQFRQVTAARDESIRADARQLPFAIEQLVLEPGSKPLGKGEYRQILAARAANDFARRLNEEPDLQAQEVTFLVNDKTEASELSEALMRRGIASAIRADRSIFQTEEADDLRQLLAALANPGRSSLKRGAYLCLNRSIDAAAIGQTAFDEEASAFFEYIAAWARQWETLNFNVAFDQLLKLGRDGGQDSSNKNTERRSSNLAQLAELLSEARTAETLSPRGLFNWLCRKREADVSQSEDWQIRISSNERKPQILTIHKSKGLEFPIVVLPFVGLRRIREDGLSIAYHGDDDEYLIDIAPQEGSPAVERAQRERLAEDARLLYVALTRAARQTIVYLCPEEIATASKLPCSSFAQFLLDEGDNTSSESVAEVLRALAEDLTNCLSFRQSHCNPGEWAEWQPIVTDAPLAAARRLSRRTRLPGPERILSFSALSKGFHHSIDAIPNLVDQSESEADEPVERDPTDEEELTREGELEAISIFTLPKGTRAGDLIHLILERFDFSQPHTLAVTVQGAFDALQFEPRAYEAIVAAQIGAIARIDLCGKFGTFRLEETALSERIAELEFAYPVSGDIKNALILALQEGDLGSIPLSWAEGLATGEQGLSASMLRGFIDLVLEREGRLYILDWKSNYLGPTPECYDAVAMGEAMMEHNYYLQYLLYCVALKRYVAWRFPGDEFADRFGGVFYIFARGVTPGRQTGIFYDCPSPMLLQSLDAALGAQQP